MWLPQHLKCLGWDEICLEADVECSWQTHGGRHPNLTCSHFCKRMISFEYRRWIKTWYSSLVQRYQSTLLKKYLNTVAKWNIKRNWHKISQNPAHTVHFIVHLFFTITFFSRFYLLQWKSAGLIWSQMTVIFISAESLLHWLAQEKLNHNTDVNFVPCLNNRRNKFVECQNQKVNNTTYYHPEFGGARQ